MVIHFWHCCLFVFNFVYFIKVVLEVQLSMREYVLSMYTTDNNIS